MPDRRWSVSTVRAWRRRGSCPRSRMFHYCCQLPRSAAKRDHGHSCTIERSQITSVLSQLGKCLLFHPASHKLRLTSEHKSLCQPQQPQYLHFLMTDCQLIRRVTRQRSPPWIWWSLVCLPRWCLRISRSPRKLSITGRVPPSSLETGSELTETMAWPGQPRGSPIQAPAPRTGRCLRI